MRIVLEGADGSGKSSIAKELSLILGMRIAWAGPPPVSDEVALMDSINQLSMDQVIFDRITPISRLCYQFDLETNHRSSLIKLLRLFADNSIIVHCCAVHEEAEDGHRSTGHDQFVAENIDKIRENYTNLLRNVRHIEHDFEKDAFESLVQKIWRAR